MCTNPFFGLGKQYVEAFSVRVGCPVFLHLKRIKHEVQLSLLSSVSVASNFCEFLILLVYCNDGGL